jgi:hypothetical protein
VRRYISPQILVALFALAVFSPSLWAGYVYDDRLLIEENYYAQSVRFVGRAFRTHLWDVHAFGSAGIGLRYYRPIVSASYVLNWVLGNGSAWSFHLVNVLAHALAALLATRVAIRWTGSGRLGTVVGLLFALHPSRTESVIWISGRTDIFMALFALLSVELAYRAAEGRRRVRFTVGAVLSMIAATLSKESGALTALLLLPDLWVAERGSAARRRLTELVVVTSALGASYSCARSLFYPVHKAKVVLEPTLRYGFFTVWSYVERIVWPWPQTFFYRPMEERGGVPFYPAAIVGLGVAASGAYVLLLVQAFRRDRVAFLLLAAAAVLLGPLLNFSYTGIYVTTSDHFLYLPLPLAAAGLLRLYRSRLGAFAPARVAAIAALGVCLLYAGVDAERVVDYRSEEASLRHELDVNPDNPVALQNLSSFVAATGDLETARALQARVVSPEATRFFLLAGTQSSRAISMARLIGLSAALTADGDVLALGHFADELERRLFSSHSSEDDSPLTAQGVLKEMAKNGHVASMAGDTALLESRLGKVQDAKRLVDALPDEMLFHLSNPLNFVLTVARLGDFKRAVRLLALSRAPPPGLKPAGTPVARAELSGRLERARKSMHAALRAPEPDAHIELALAFAELGAYLQALRVVRPVFEASPHPPQVDPLYVQLLMSARLDDEALRTATSLLGESRARATVSELRARLGPRLRALPKVPEPSPWWP